MAIILPSELAISTNQLIIEFVKVGLNQSWDFKNLTTFVISSCTFKFIWSSGLLSIIEKYQSLAHDSQLSGDRVSAENFQQHSEHYARLLLEAQKEIAERAAAQENPTEEGGSIKEKTQNDSYEAKDLSDVSSLKEQKAKISLEQNIDTA